MSAKKFKSLLTIATELALVALKWEPLQCQVMQAQLTQILKASRATISVRTARPGSAERKSWRDQFDNALDVDRGEMLLRLRGQGFSTNELVKWFRMGAHQLRAFCAMAELPTEIKQVIRQHKLKEIHIRHLHDHPEHVSMSDLVRLVAQHRPTRRQIEQWMNSVLHNSKSDSDPEQILQEMLQSLDNQDQENAEYDS